MKFWITVREEKRGKYRVPVMSLGPLLAESGDGIRIQRNAIEWHNRIGTAIVEANRATNKQLKAIRN